ncbi:Protein of unknown function [Bacillus cereus]|nr:Protein of unknown function [Bacillus cereus]
MSGIAGAFGSGLSATIAKVVSLAMYIF